MRVVYDNNNNYNNYNNNDNNNNNSNSHLLVSVPSFGMTATVTIARIVLSAYSSVALIIT